MKHTYYMHISYDGVDERQFYGTREEAEALFDAMKNSLIYRGATIKSEMFEEEGEDDE